MSIDAAEVLYIKQIGGGNFGQVYLAVSVKCQVFVRIVFLLNICLEVASDESSGEGDQRRSDHTISQRTQFDDVSTPYRSFVTVFASDTFSLRSRDIFVGI